MDGRLSMIYSLKKKLFRNKIYKDDALLKDKEIVEYLNNYESVKKDLSFELANTKGILDYFLEMTNRLQKECNDEFLKSQAQDMLRMMGVNII